MHHTSLLALTAVLAAPAAAQLSTTVVSTTDSPRSIVSTGPFVIVSLQQSARQVAIDVTNPVAPVVGPIYDPPLGDQFANSAWTPAFGGRLVLGHRGGGMNLIDTAGAPTLGSLFSGPTSTAKYLHEGLETWLDTTGRAFVAYSEHNVGNSGGGLRLFEITTTAAPGDTLTHIGADILVGRDGNGLEISAVGRTVWQWGWSGNNATNVHLAAWDTAGWAAPPTLLNSVPVPVTLSNYDRQLERNAASDNLVGTLGWDGLVAVDVRNPANPVVTTVLADPTTFHFDGVRVVPNSNLAMVWGIIRVGTVDVDFLAFVDATIPGFAIPILAIAMPFQIADIAFGRGRTYVLGRDRTTSATTLTVY